MPVGEATRAEVGVVDRARRALGGLPGALRDPVTQSDLLQVVKIAGAAVVAWVISVKLGFAQQFLAPWAAMLTVHASVYRTVSRGAQAVAATGLGVLLSYLVSLLFGFGVASLAVALLAGMLLSRIGVLRDEGVTVATTALFVLTSGAGQQEIALLSRIGETSLGVGVGLVVNLLVLPPLNNRSAVRHVDDINRQLGGLLQDMARDLRGEWDEDLSQRWVDTTRAIDDELDHAWSVVRHLHESTRWNPRYFLSKRAEHPATYQDVLRRLEDGVAQVRSMAQTIHESTVSAKQWDTRFREPWLDLMDEVGKTIADPEDRVHSLRDDVDDLIRQLSHEELPGLWWPVYGSLISNLSNVVDVVDDVASAKPVRT